MFAETLPLEAKRMILSRAATRRHDGKVRKILFIDAKKVHLNPKVEGNVYIDLPQEANCPPGMCGKLNYWLYGFRPAAAWEERYSRKLVECGFQRGQSCTVGFIRRGTFLV